MEISSAAESPIWTEMTTNEKNQWVAKCIIEKKAEIGSVFRHQCVIDLNDLIMDDNSKDLKNQTNELLTMSDILPRVPVTEYCSRAIRLKLLEDKCVSLNSELENKEKMIKHLFEQLSKDTRSQETQTCGINIEELENSSSDISAKNLSLRLELNSSKEVIELLERDLINKSDELTSVSTENSFLKSITENLNKTLEEMKEKNSKQIELIKILQTERYKFIQDFFEVQKERDEYYESWMHVKNEYEKTSVKLKHLKSESDTIRREEIHKSMIESDLINKSQQLEKEVSEKVAEMTKLKSSVEQLDKSITKYGEVDEEQMETLKKLKASVTELETRAECWINRYVRDKFESKTNHLEQQVGKMETDKKLLSDKYDKTTSENSKQTAKNDGKIEKLHSYTGEQQTPAINIMRCVKFNPEEYEQPSLAMKSVSLKFEDEQKMKHNFKKLIEENYRMQKMNRSAYN